MFSLLMPVVSIRIPFGVRVVDFVTLTAGPDTTICLTDTINLRPTGDGLKFLWSPAATLDDPTLKNPAATPTASLLIMLLPVLGNAMLPVM